MPPEPSSPSVEHVVLPWVGSEKCVIIIRECVPPVLLAKLAAAAEGQGFVGDDYYFVPADGRQAQRCERALVNSDLMAGQLYAHVRAMLPVTVDERSCCGLSQHLRFLRYGAGNGFMPHTDGPSERAGGDEISMLSFILYLNDDYQGGCTRFIDPHCSRVDAVSIVPAAGDVLVFSHDLLHEGATVSRGVKRVMRTDVMYRRTADPDVLRLQTESASPLRPCCAEARAL